MAICPAEEGKVNPDTKIRTHTRCKCRVQNININTYIGLIVPDALFNLLHDATYADAVDIAGCDDVKTAADIIFYVFFGPRDGCANPDVYGGVEDEAL